jgi:hypothetical protein
MTTAGEDSFGSPYGAPAVMRNHDHARGLAGMSFRRPVGANARLEQVSEPIVSLVTLSKPSTSQAGYNVSQVRFGVLDRVANGVQNDSSCVVAEHRGVNVSNYLTDLLCVTRQEPQEVL